MRARDFFNSLDTTNQGSARLNVGAGVGLVLNASGGLRRLASGATINAGQAFAGGGANLIVLQSGAPVQGTWASGQTGFGAFRLAGGELGWVRLRWTDGAQFQFTPANLTAIDWAYNNVPGESLLAGQTSSPIPEPSTTALLALAGAGAAALRHRRRRPAPTGTAAA